MTGPCDLSVEEVLDTISETADLDGDTDLVAFTGRLNTLYESKRRKDGMPTPADPSLGEGELPKPRYWGIGPTMCPPAVLPPAPLPPRSHGVMPASEDIKPMDDRNMLVQRLRAGRFNWHLNQAAADEIERLRVFEEYDKRLQDSARRERDRRDDDIHQPST